MPIQNAFEMKDKVLSVLKRRGPCLPIHVAKDTGMSMLFSSAFLSELIADKKVRVSDMKVGGSPLYLIPGQEPMLENFSQYLKSKEKDAFLLLKENKFLKDTELEPAIRVALRGIKDFAFPLNYNKEIYWKYITAQDSEFSPSLFKQERVFEITPKVETQVVEIKQQISAPVAEIKQLFEEAKKPEIMKNEVEQISKIEDIFEKEDKEDKQEVKRSNKKVKSKKVIKKSKPKSKKDDKFFIKVKDFLNEKSIEIIDIVGISKNDLTLKVKTKNGERLLIAHKKKISEEDIIKASRKAEDFNLPYIVISISETSKKFSNLIDAIKKLDKIEKIE